MYASYFGLRREPFSIAPDPRYLYLSERHREALAHLLYGIEGGGGFVLLTGEIGAGKTTVCRAFLEQIPTHCRVAYIFNPKLTVNELLQTICDEFGIATDTPPAESESVKGPIDALNAFLLASHAQGQNCVLIIDEAQNLSAEVLEQLRLLTNLETSERKLLQIILIGQPELQQQLARPELEQLAQRVLARYHLPALALEDTGRYIAHRLTVAGATVTDVFTPQAIKRIHQITRGVPRRINLVCDRALLGAYGQERRKVDAAMVDQAAREVFGLKASTSPAPRPNAWQRVPTWVWGAMGGVSVGCFASAAYLYLQQPTQRPEAGAAPPTVVTAPTPETSPRAAAPAPLTATSSPEPVTAAATMAAFNAWLQGAPRREDEAWIELGALWQADLSGGEPCRQAVRQQLQCFQNSGGLALIQQLGRPCALFLYDERGRPAYALLTALVDGRATLQFRDQTLTVALTDLAKVWRGEFATLWRAPPGYRKRIEAGEQGPAVDWLAARMALLQQQEPPSGPQTYHPALQAQVHAFQIAQGIKPDGMAGAMTFMQLHHATGVDEPRLRTAP